MVPRRGNNNDQQCDTQLTSLKEELKAAQTKIAAYEAKEAQNEEMEAQGKLKKDRQNMLGRTSKVGFQWPKQDTASTAIAPQALKTVTTVAGFAGRTTTPKLGVGDAAWLARGGNPKCGEEIALGMFGAKKQGTIGQAPRLLAVLSHTPSLTMQVPQRLDEH